MGDIFICTLIFLGAIPFFFVLGQCFSKNERDSFSYNFVLGYLIFTAASAVFGIMSNKYFNELKTMLLDNYNGLTIYDVIGGYSDDDKKQLLFNIHSRCIVIN